MRKVVTLLLTFTLSALTLLLPSGVEGQQEDSSPPQRPTGKIVRSYRHGEEAQPAWVEDALRRSMAYLRRHGKAAGVRDPQAELTLKDAKQDDLGMTHVKFDQLYKGVPVFGRQIIIHFEGDTARNVTGRVSEGVHGLNITPTLSVAQAVEAVRAALDPGGGAAHEPEAKLVILPARDGSSGVALVYQVRIFVEYSDKAPERHEYFVDAGNGGIV